MNSFFYFEVHVFPEKEKTAHRANFLMAMTEFCNGSTVKLRNRVRETGQAF